MDNYEIKGLGELFNDSDCLNLEKRVGDSYTSKAKINKEEDIEEIKDIKVIGPGWTKTGNSFFPHNEIIEGLPAGIYKGDSYHGRLIYKRMPSIDDYVDLPDSPANEMVKHINEFWISKDKYKKLGITYKRGIFLYGPPGSSKSASIISVIKSAIESEDAVVISDDYPYDIGFAIDAIRRIEKNRKIIVVMEDMDSMVRRFGDAYITRVLDGDESTDNIVFLATTNFPQLLPQRLFNRPSRFDKVLAVEMPSANDRLAYFKAKVPDLPPTTYKVWVEKTAGLGVAHLKELIISVVIYKKDLDETIAYLKKMAKLELDPNLYTYSAKEEKPPYVTELSFNIEQPDINTPEPKVEIASPIINVRLPGPKAVEKTIDRDERGFMKKVTETQVYDDEDNS